MTRDKFLDGLAIGILWTFLLAVYAGIWLAEWRVAVILHLFALLLWAWGRWVTRYKRRDKPPKRWGDPWYW